MNHIDIFSFWLHINQLIILLRISSTRVFMMIIFLSAQTSSSMSWIKNINLSAWSANEDWMTQRDIERHVKNRFGSNNIAIINPKTEWSSTAYEVKI